MMNVTLKAGKKSSIHSLFEMRDDGGKTFMLVITLGFVIVFYTIFLIFPILYALVGSFFDWNPLVNKFNFIGSTNYANAMKDPLFWLSMGNTLYFTVVTVLFRTIIALFIAVIINSVTRFKSLFRTIYFMPVITSMVAVSMVWKWMYDPKIGIFNMILQALGMEGLMWLKDANQALPSIMIMTVWKDMGFALVIFMAGLTGIPTTYYEAARIDGAGGWKAFRYITLPLLKPTMLFVLVTAVIGYLQVFTQVFMMTKGGPETASYTIVYHLYYEAFSKYNFGYASAISFLLFVVIVVFSLLQFKMMKSDWGY